MEIRTLSQQQLASMSLQEACKAIQALYTPEEWARMAHTPAATFTAEQIEQAAEPTVSRLTGLFREYCRCCHLVQTYGRDQHNLPLCQSCAEKEVTLIFSYDSQQKGYFSVVNPPEHLYRNFGIATQFSSEEWFVWSVNARQQGFTFQVKEQSS